MTTRHNEVRDELRDLAACAFTPSIVCDEPKLNTCHFFNDGKTSKPLVNNDARGDVMIQDM
jgi:hypothetical protein